MSDLPKGNDPSKKVLRRMNLNIQPTDSNSPQQNAEPKQEDSIKQDSFKKDKLPKIPFVMTSNPKPDQDSRHGASELPTIPEPNFPPQPEIKIITHPNTEELPEMIADRYRVLRIIGRGGMGVVLLARDTKLERYVAIKRVVFRSSNMRIVQRRFIREAQTIASLGHANIVQIYDIGQTEEVAYITMEYVAGPKLGTETDHQEPPLPVNLDQYIKKKGPMTLDEGCELILKLCSAVGYAHKRGTIHRDIKPSNILLTESLEPKLVDFGLARPIHITKTEEITLEGTMLGTPEYSAPEQWGDMKSVGPPADLYALGGVFWFVLSGKIPRFYREKDVDPRIAPILTKLMAAKPADRYQSASELANAIISAKGERRTFVPTINTSISNSETFTPNSPSQSTPSDTKISSQHAWLCPNCNRLNPEAANYCVSCGASGRQICKLCGAEMKVGVQFCPKCGEDLKRAEEIASLILAAKNSASFLEYESALDQIRDLAQKGNPEAKRLAEEWHQIILRRRNLILEFENAIRLYNLDKAVEICIELRKITPAECISEIPDFDTVVKVAELTNELKKVLVESATQAHQEYNLERFSKSIQSLNRIFGEDVCGAINSQLNSILSELDQALTEAGLALGMNCISRAMDIISQIPPWHGGDLGERRTRIAKSCEELLEEREKSIDEIETLIRKEQYSEALRYLRKMARFRLPPEHSEMEPAPADIQAHERIMQIDKQVIQTISNQLETWIKKNQWEEIRNALLILQEGDTRTWKDLLKQMRYTIKQEVNSRYEEAKRLERQGKFNAAQNAWQNLLLIPSDLMPPQYYSEAIEFTDRKNVAYIRRIKVTTENGVGILFMLFFLLHSWMVWAPVFLNMDGWWILFSWQENYRRGMIELPPGTWWIYAQLIIFIIGALLAPSRYFHYTPRQLSLYASHPRLAALNFLIILSPLPMAFYELFYHWVYLQFQLRFYWHPAILLCGLFLLLDFAKGFKKERVPANCATFISWLIVLPFILWAPRWGETELWRVPILYPENAPLPAPFFWPKMAIIQSAIFASIMIGEHLIYRFRFPMLFKKEENPSSSNSIVSSPPSSKSKVIRPIVSYHSQNESESP